ncbi:MAG: hypothetical protein ACI8RD_011137 [Bacillariaceae sp.]
MCKIKMRTNYFFYNKFPKTKIGGLATTHFSSTVHCIQKLHNKKV